MKKVIYFFIAFAGLCFNRLFAQPTEAMAREKLLPFSEWVGQWRGEGSMQMGPGEPKKSLVEEKVEMKLNGTLLMVEGIGKTIDAATKTETVAHHALGILSYDQTKSQYKFSSHLKDGRSTDAWMKTVDKNKFQWGFDIPGGGKIIYTIVLDPKAGTWNEIGEYSHDGNAWSKFFEMNLKKVG